MVISKCWGKIFVSRSIVTYKIKNDEKNLKKWRKTKIFIFIQNSFQRLRNDVGMLFEWLFDWKNQKNNFWFFSCFRWKFWKAKNIREDKQNKAFYFQSYSLHTFLEKEFRNCLNEKRKISILRETFFDKNREERKENS